MLLEVDIEMGSEVSYDFSFVIFVIHESLWEPHWWVGKGCMSFSPNFEFFH